MAKNNHSHYHDLPFQNALAPRDMAWLTKKSWNPRGATQADKPLILYLRNHWVQIVGDQIRLETGIDSTLRQ
jgi:hypothetical protein